MTRSVKLAVVQDAPVAFDVAASLVRVATILGRVASERPDIVLFPEAFISGFPAGTDWGGDATAIRSSAGGIEYERYFNGAIEIPGPECSALGAMARDHSLDLVIGVIERQGTTLNCSVLHFNCEGDLVHVRRKVMPTMAERTIWGQADGASLQAATLGVGRVASVICWENYMPLLRQAMYSQNVEIYCAPTADDLDGWVNSMRHIAVEGRCFVMSACQFSRRRDFPADYGWFPSDDPEFVTSRGGSCIVDPSGELLAGPVYDREAILTATVDLDAVVRARHSFDVTGHYARPDIFRLMVDRRARSSVTFADD